MMIDNLVRRVPLRAQHRTEALPNERHGILVHRINTPNPAPLAMARYLRSREPEQFAVCPYAIYIYKGRAYQLVDLNVVTPHARRWNKSRIGVAVCGDFRLNHEMPPAREKLGHVGGTPSADDVVCLAQTLALVCWVWRWRPWDHHDNLQAIAGHTDAPGGTKDEHKVCPGSILDIPLLRTEVASEIETLPEWPGWADREIFAREAGLTF